MKFHSFIFANHFIPFAIFFSCYRLQAQLLEVLDTGSKAPQIDSEIVELTNELKELFEVGGDQIDYTMEWAKKAQEIIKQPTRTRHDHQIDSSSEESRRLDLWFHESMYLSSVEINSEAGIAGS